MTSKPKTRLFLMCVPRSRSTSLLKCLSFVEGVEAWFEPYVTALIARREYADHTGDVLPTDWDEGLEAEFERAGEFMRSTNKYLPKVPGRMYAYSEMKHIIETSTSSSIIIKDVSVSFNEGCLEYLPSARANFKYVFIIRDPYLVATSYRKAAIKSWLNRGTLDEADAVTFELRKDRYYGSEGGSFKVMSSVLKHVRENLDNDPLIIDSEDLVANPEPFLRKICQVGGIKFKDELQEWDSSPEIIKTWKSPAKFYDYLINDGGCFHHRALNSSCFIAGNGANNKPEGVNLNLTEDIEVAIRHGNKYYNEMFKQRFVPSE